MISDTPYYLVPTFGHRRDKKGCLGQRLRTFVFAAVLVMIDFYANLTILTSSREMVIVSRHDSAEHVSQLSFVVYFQVNVFKGHPSSINAMVAVTDSLVIMGYDDGEIRSV